MAEAGGDGLPYIGSIMSLVSHGDIRYEGTLYTVDMPNSTIALSNVRCYGSEGRRKEGDEVPPSDQVFEYVVFKGGEIKELTVVQPPPPAPPAPPPMGFSDPAIASVGPPPPGPPPGAAAPWGAPPPPAPYGAPPPGAAFGSSPWGPPPPGGAPPPPPPGQPAPAPAPTVAITAVNGTAAPRQPPASYAHAAGGRTPAQGQRQGGRGQGRQGAPQHQHQHQHQQRQGGGRQQGGQHQQQQPRPPPVEVPKEEFKFEEMLKKFNKEGLVQEAEQEHVPVAPKEAVYNKDDFFDQLSCDTLERLHLQEEGERGDWRAKMAAQRKVDVETFGGLGVARGRGYRGRGRGHRYYGGGGGRGRGGRGRGGQQQQQAPPAAV